MRCPFPTLILTTVSREVLKVLFLGWGWAEVGGGEAGVGDLEVHSIPGGTAVAVVVGGALQVRVRSRQSTARAVVQWDVEDLGNHTRIMNKNRHGGLRSELGKSRSGRQSASIGKPNTQ